MARHRRERALRIEWPVTLEAEDAAAVMKCRQEPVHQPTDPGPVRGGPKKVALLWKKVMGQLETGQVTEKDAMGVERALGRPRGA